MKHRHRQLESEIVRAVQEALARGLSDPRLDGAMITILGVDLTPEADRAVARVSVLPDKAQARALAALNHAAAHLRRKISDALDLTSAPQLRFTLDTSLKRHAAVIDALGRIADERRAASPDPPTPDPDAPEPHAPEPGPAGDAPPVPPHP